MRLVALILSLSVCSPLVAETNSSKQRSIGKAETKKSSIEDDWYVINLDACGLVTSMEPGIRTPDDVKRKYECKDEPRPPHAPRDRFIALNCEAKLGTVGHFRFVKGKTDCLKILNFVKKNGQ
jgi:hypothetical protein